MRVKSFDTIEELEFDLLEDLRIKKITVPVNWFVLATKLRQLFNYEFKLLRFIKKSKDGEIIAIDFLDNKLFLIDSKVNLNKEEGFLLVSLIDEKTTERDFDLLRLDNKILSKSYLERKYKELEEAYLKFGLTLSHKDEMYLNQMMLSRPNNSKNEEDIITKDYFESILNESMQKAESFRKKIDKEELRREKYREQQIKLKRQRDFERKKKEEAELRERREREAKIENKIREDYQNKGIFVSEDIYLDIKGKIIEDEDEKQKFVLDEEVRDIFTFDEILKIEEKSPPLVQLLVTNKINFDFYLDGNRKFRMEFNQDGEPLIEGVLVKPKKVLDIINRISELESGSNIKVNKEQIEIWNILNPEQIDLVMINNLSIEIPDTILNDSEKYVYDIDSEGTLDLDITIKPSKNSNTKTLQVSRFEIELLGCKGLISWRECKKILYDLIDTDTLSDYENGSAKKVSVEMEVKTLFDLLSALKIKKSVAYPYLKRLKILNGLKDNGED